MKLLHYTNMKLSALLFFLIGVWGVSFFLAIHYEITDETDDMLRNYRDVFVKKALQQPELLNVPYETTFDRYTIRPLTDEEAEEYESSWENTLLYFPEGDEHIPVRVYKSLFRASDDRFYELEISMSTLERDDMIETLCVYLFVLYVSLLLCSIIGNGWILKQSFRPLQKLLVWLDSIVPGKPIPEQHIKTQIVEFRQLNEATLSMSRRNLQAYEQQKQFIENASHELQTPLAVAQNKLELMAQQPGMTEKLLSDVAEIYTTLNRAVKLNKSLLLLSRIDNCQFQDVERVNISGLVVDLSDDFMEIYTDKHIVFSFEEKSVLWASMNENLSQVLVSNLLKNAFVHTPAHGTITVMTTSDTLSVMNTGEEPLDGERIFDRFYHSGKHAGAASSGLGLAIVKSICALYHIDVHYRFTTQHEFELKFAK